MLTGAAVGGMALVEPASCIFSAAHIPVTLFALYRMYWHQDHRRHLAFWGVYTAVGWAGLAAWVFSALHHGTHWEWATRVDYFGALLYLTALATCAVVRGLELHDRTVRLRVVQAALAAWVLRCVSMQVWGFDYSINMALCVAMYAVHAGGWVWLALRRSNRHPQSKQILSLSVMLAACGCLELWDFPPLWGIMDAHAIWHSLTPLVTLLWHLLVVEKDLEFLTATKDK